MSDTNLIRLLAGQRNRTPAARGNTTGTRSSAPFLSHRYSHNDLLGSALGSSSTTVPRLPSWQSFEIGAASTTANSAEPPLTADGTIDGDLQHTDAGHIWYNPSANQMIEALRVVMMTKPTMEPLSPEYNSNILHLIESHSQLQKKLHKSKKKLMESEVRRGIEMEETEAREQRWKVSEGKHKAEIKRLELLIHEGSGGGVEAVILARSGSLLKRSQQPEQISSLPGNDGKETTRNLQNRRFGDSAYNCRR